MKIQSYNPNDNSLIGEIEETNTFEIKDIVLRSRKASENWCNLSLDERCEYINKLSEVINDNKSKLAELVTKEMGMPITESLFDIDSGLDYIKWYIDNSKSIIGDEITYEDEQEIDKIIYEPKGVAAVIIAWNFPFSSFVWQAVTNLIVGNTVVIKHSELVPLSSKFIYELVSKVLPKDVYNVVYGARKCWKRISKSRYRLNLFYTVVHLLVRVYIKLQEKSLFQLLWNVVAQHQE